mmetsp:Transcript_53838/g.64981  ORF Transcript_53838/g.64981 Transcript_53838/m.64981 type:complete len:178 (+) Transcript_53838:46-579(+)|eukprot:CAMPEP_0172509840 /NCGR_PEP_ID=MMETSP1066-20121228/223723_1 /TAXON_ID=671091 /ORGANISM="Coscinodiscus wailesii, Strain CCMP2513" /LENGTH=177 /DNA_ID=CAMNT_0013288535 /DNA_START=44 /DNA_END=577 /DNA_ORIENTATION=-
MSTSSIKSPENRCHSSKSPKRKQSNSYFSYPWSRKKIVADNDEDVPFLKRKNCAIPGTRYFPSNHTLVNDERMNRHIPPLTGLPILDMVARTHAQTMAKNQRLHNSEAKDLANKLPLQFEKMGQNVMTGTSVGEIHQLVMESQVKQRNILDPDFVVLGVGTARGEDGIIYLCQIFAG